MFDKQTLDSLFDELRRDWRGKPDYDQLLRDAHLAIALSDAGRPLGADIDRRVADLIEKHRGSL